MKYRLGFVSNSSSSSFIATFAIVIDKDKFKAFQERVGKEYKIISTLQEFIDKAFDLRDYDFNNEMPDLGDIELATLANPIILNYGVGPSGDYSFKTSEDADIDYDIGLERFDDKDVLLYKANEEDGIKVLKRTFYAGRNG